MNKKELIKHLAQAIEHLSVVEKNLAVYQAVQGSEVDMLAQRMQMEFEPFTQQSEQMVLSLLNNDFVDDGKDYKNYVGDLYEPNPERRITLIEQHLDDGMIHHLLSVVSVIQNSILTKTQLEESVF